MAKYLARSRRGGVRLALAWAFASVSGFALSAPALAQTSSANTETSQRDFDIPAQPLATALLRFAEQSDLQVLFAHDDLAGLSSRPLRGRFTPEAALAQLLPSGAPQIEIAGDRIVRGTPARPQYADDAEAPAEEEAIVVTGTRIRGAQPAGANIIALDAETLRETGRSTLQDALAPLPQNFLGGQNELTQLQSLTGGNNTTFGSTINLRGLGADATLTLVNGRRLAPGGVGNFVDISTIPFAAVERVEILADGASATYGS